MSADAFLKSLKALERMAKPVSKGVAIGVSPLEGPLTMTTSRAPPEPIQRPVDRGGDTLGLFERACEIFSEKFISGGTHYGREFHATMLVPMFHELSFRLRQRGHTTQPDNQPNPGGMTVLYRLPCDTTLRLHGRDHILPMPGYPSLPDNAVAISDPKNNELLCVFDFGFTISDVCVHTEYDNIKSYLLAKGLGREKLDQELNGLFIERSKKANWNF